MRSWSIRPPPTHRSLHPGTDSARRHYHAHLFSHKRFSQLDPRSFFISTPLPVHSNWIFF